MTSAEKETTDAKKMREEANQAEMTSSPVLNNDAETDENATGEQFLPEGNRFK